MLGLVKVILAIGYIVIIRIFLKFDKEMKDNQYWNYLNNLDENWRYYAIAIIFILINMILL